MCARGRSMRRGGNHKGTKGTKEEREEGDGSDGASRSHGSDGTDGVGGVVGGVDASRLPLRGVGGQMLHTPGSKTHPGLRSRAPLGRRSVSGGKRSRVVEWLGGFALVGPKRPTNGTQRRRNGPMPPATQRRRNGPMPPAHLLAIAIHLPFRSRCVGNKGDHYVR